MTATSGRSGSPGESGRPGSGTGRWQRAIARWLAPVAGALIVLLLFAAVGVWLAWLAAGRQPGPPASGRAVVPALSADLEIARDPFGVPHVEAASVGDAFLGLGFVHAQDRLWQIEVLRRAARGRLSELFGAATLPADRMARVLGFGRDADAEAAELPADVAEILGRYCDGVNAWRERVNDGRERRPFELRWLELEPEPWTPGDVLAITRLRAWSQSRSLGVSLLLDRLVRELGGVPSRDFFPVRPRDGAHDAFGALLDPRLVEPARASDALARAAGLHGPVGSSGFLVGATRSRSGQPLLANDPHVEFRLPPLFHLSHLRTPDFELGGAALPGTPLFVAGTNLDIAWGQVALHASVSDLFDETFHPDDRLRYERGGRWRKARERRETISVRGGDDVEFGVVATHNGPLLRGAFPTRERVHTLSLRWAGARARGSLGALLDVQRAGSWDEFRQALRPLVAPAASFLYADRQGRIGTQVAGRLPVRAIETGLLPVTGGSRFYDWRGFEDFDDLPSQVGADLDWLVVSTHPDDPDLARRVTWLWSSPGGADRLESRLDRASKLDLDDVVALQRERRSGRGQRALDELLRDVEPRSRSARRIAELLRAWDGDTGVDSVGAAVYHVFRQRLARRILADELDGDYFEALNEVSEPIPGLVLARFLDRVGPRAAERLVERALDDTWSHLRTELSANPRKWTWGNAHRLHLEHDFARLGRGRLAWLGLRLGRGPYPAPGDPDSVWAMHHRELPTERLGVGPALRFAIDMADPRHAQVGLAGGQSGAAGDPHYDDALADWLAGRPRPLWMHRGDVAYHRVGVWELRPDDRTPP